MHSVHPGDERVADTGGCNGRGRGALRCRVHSSAVPKRGGSPAAQGADAGDAGGLAPGVDAEANAALAVVMARGVPEAAAG